MITRTPLLIEAYDTTWKELSAKDRSYWGVPEPLANKAAENFNKRMKDKGHDLRIGARIGKGSQGVVHKGHIRGTVVKFVTKGAESDLAQHMLDNQDEHGHIKTLPRFYSVHDTGEARRGDRVMAIHREDIRDISYRHGAKWSKFGNEYSRLHHQVRDAAVRIANKTGRDEHDIHGRLLRSRYRQLVNEHRKNFKGTSHEGEYDRVSRDLGHLMKHGISICDLGSYNWGQRHNGEVVIRDPGCWNAHKPARPL